MASIRYLNRTDIDDRKWDECLNAAGNGLIYGYAYYLDAMCTAWDGLVLDDYKAVMPLPWRKKWNVQYLYQPFAVAQLGLFGNTLSAELLYGFLKKIPAHFRYWDLPLNFQNVFLQQPFPLYQRKNFVLALDKPYETIAANYRQQLKRNLKKATAGLCIIQKDIPIDEVVMLAKNHHANKATNQDYIRFEALFHLLSKQEKAVTYGVTNSGGELLASAVFFYSHHRAYYILPGNQFNARTTGASPFLLDAFIKNHASENLVLDFEGSDVPGLQFFYSSFGAVEEPYAAIRHNRLPLLLKWLKR